MCKTTRRMCDEHACLQAQQVYSGINLERVYTPFTCNFHPFPHSKLTYSCCPDRKHRNHRFEIPVARPASRGNAVCRTASEKRPASLPEFARARHRSLQPLAPTRSAACENSVGTGVL